MQENRAFQFGQNFLPVMYSQSNNAAGGTLSQREATASEPPARSAYIFFFFHLIANQIIQNNDSDNRKNYEYRIPSTYPHLDD